ncbi:MAG: hypothetical protein FWG09_06610, partial [Synergistaceae bacterium]|nr:hypothetical protein [Synergistaceae bacterium]
VFRDHNMVAEYWTALPPKKEFEAKIHALLLEERERLERRKLFLPDIQNSVRELKDSKERDKPERGAQLEKENSP